MFGDSDMPLLIQGNSDNEFWNKLGVEPGEYNGFWRPTMTHGGDSDTILFLCQKP